MPIVISEDLVATVTTGALNNPSIGYINYVTVANITTFNPDDDTEIEDAEHPTINMANPSTYLYFQQDTAGEDAAVQVLLDGLNLVDYIGIAGHTFGSGARRVQLFGATQLDEYSQPVYSALSDQQIFGSDQPIMYRFDPDYYVGLKLVAEATTTDTLQIAVVYVGKLLVSERMIQVAFTPITMGRKRDVTNQRGEAGSFLGRMMIGQFVESAAHISHMSPSFYREEFDPFVNEAGTEPFFFAWAPIDWPLEVGYAWLMEEPIPEIHDPTGLMQITLRMQGIVE